MRLRGAAAGYLGQTVDLAHGLGLHRRHMQAYALQQRRDDAVAVFQQRRQNMCRLQLRVAVLAGEIVRPLHGFLRFYG